MPLAVVLVTAGMLVLALVVNTVANRLGWFQPKTDGDRLYLLKVTPAVETPDSADFIEVDQVGPKVMPAYIKMYGDGRVERDAVSKEFGYVPGCPISDADRQIKIAPADAQRVISKARNRGFYGLMNNYRASGEVFDAGTSVVTLSIHGRVKRVSDHAGSPPPLFAELIDDIWQLSPMDEFVYPWRFSTERRAECEKFLGNVGK